MPLNRASLRRRLHRAALPLRRRLYTRGSGRRLVRLLPDRLVGVLGLDDPSAIRTRCIEIGSGEYPTAGCLHIDVWRDAPHLEATAPAWALPFPDNWAERILTIHTLEHIEPRLVARTLAEWKRVLRPNGLLRVSVPNAPALMESYRRAGIDEKWALSSALLGIYASKDVRSPLDLRDRADHQVLYDFELLASLLDEAGFTEIRNRTMEIVDRHTEGWRPLVDYCSLVVEARA
jgi:predicted SAM-dependent methyltransferase